MKRLALTTALLALCACGPAARFEHQDLVMLSPDSFQTKTGRGNLRESIASLGSPATTQVNIRACPAVAFQDFHQVKIALEQAGYRKIGFGQPDKTRCPLTSPAL